MKANGPETEHRPWGSFTILDEGRGYKVKRIQVSPGTRLSYQKHSHRQEHWTLIQGRARVTLEGREVLLGSGESIDIGIGQAHRIANPGPGDLVFIEIQRGTYLGEDDIERLEDDYGRA